jgi:hypothetical protein
MIFKFAAFLLVMLFVGDIWAVYGVAIPSTGSDCEVSCQAHLHEIATDA